MMDYYGITDDLGVGTINLNIALNPVHYFDQIECFKEDLSSILGNILLVPINDKLLPLFPRYPAELIQYIRESK